MKISIVIPIFNKYQFTKACLNDLFKLPDDNEIIIIDNASTDESEKELSQINKSNFIYLKNSVNLFHSKGCNLGFAKASADVVLFLNNDIKVRSNYETWTNKVIDCCTDNKIIGPTFGQLDNKFNFIKEDNKLLNGMSYISGWFIAANKKTWNKLDLSKNEIWSEKFPMYFNDADLSFRARKLGIQLECMPNSDVVHFGKISSSQLNVNKLYNEGRATFLKKYDRFLGR